jgi:hypothetical protein
MNAWILAFAFQCFPLFSSPPMCRYASGKSAAISPRKPSRSL